MIPKYSDHPEPTAHDYLARRALEVMVELGRYNLFDQAISDNNTLAALKRKARRTIEAANAEPINIPENTFAAACYDQNSIEEIERALEPDAPWEDDAKAWGLTRDELRAQLLLALQAKRTR